MKKMILSGLIVLSLPTLVMAANGSYIKGEVGGVIVSDGTNKMFNWNKNPSGSAARIAVGYLTQGRALNMGIEAGTLYFPNAKLRNSSYSLRYKGHAVDLLAVLKHDLNNGLNVFAKGGVAYLHQKAKVELYDVGSGTFTGHRVAPEVALGVGYQVNRQAGVDFTVSSILAGKPHGSSNNPVAQTQTATVGFTYNIG